MVETHSAVCSMDHLNYHLDTPLLDKGDLNSQFHTIDQHSTVVVESPRVSSTPPSTPGLESIQGNETKDDEDDDYADYTDYAYDEYINGDYSEPDEDYFFKDFATNTNNRNHDNNSSNTDRPKSKRYSRRRRSQETMSRFDLQSFARQLHANRLSVLQTRQSRMILTEEDEQELEKLLARKATRSSPRLPPPVPALPPVPASVSQPSPLTTSTPPTPPSAAEQETEMDTSNTSEGFKATVIEPSATIGLAGPASYGSFSPDSFKKPSLLLQKLNDQHRPSIRSKDTTFIEMIAPLSPSLSDPSSFTSPRRAPTPPSESSSPFSLSASLSSSSTSTSTTEKDRKPSSPVTTTVTLGPAPTIFTLKKKSSWITNRKQLKTRDQPKVASAPLSPLSHTATTQLRPSISLDSLRDQSSETWKLTKASPTKPAIATTTKSSSASPSATPTLENSSSSTNKKPKSRLFGSLRQASRSSRAAGEGAIRGLMRNLSTVGHRQQNQQQQHADQMVSSSTDKGAISRAAISVIQHDVSNNTSKKNSTPTNKKSKTVSTSALPQGLDPMEGMDDNTVQVTHTATSTKGGVRLLSNLLAKARSRRSSPSTKRTTHTPLNDTDSTAIKERNKIVRRTIIYVQPDALDFMKDGHMPPIPAPKSSHLENLLLSDDDVNQLSKNITIENTASDTVEYATATKLTRQTSRRKRLVEEQQQQQIQHPHATTATTDHKKWRLESVSEFNIADCPNNNNNNNSDDKLDENKNDDDNDKDLYDYYHANDNSRLEGLELREMSDGSVVWGIVKKQGDRKSFFASKALEDSMTTMMMEQQQAEKEHDQIEKSVLALMGLEPDSLDHFTARRSNTASSSGSGQSRTSSNSITTSNNNTTSSSPPPIPKRSPRRNHGSGSKHHQQQQDDQVIGDSKRVQRGLSVEEQLDEMMLSLKQSQF